MSSVRKASMRSVQQTHDAIIDTLRRATDRITLPEICRRAKLSEPVARPAITIMVKNETVLVSNTRPTVYSLPASTRAAPRQVHKVRGTYQGEELRRNVGIDPARLEAFALPSRVGNRLYYPDGRVEPVPSLREVVA